MRSKGKGKKKSQPENERTDIIEKIDMNNDRLFAYYRAQKIVPAQEWEEFVESLRQHLPTTFRVAGSRQTANTLSALIEDIHVPALSDVVFEDLKIPPPVQITWYPDGLAWQFNVPKKVLRKSPEFKKFHSFLVFETEVGNISRQEAVSMIPPLFLEVEPHQKVMDMCAAPGSKTAQILEALHARDTVTSSSIPSGLLIANDSDSKRTHLLIHQSARLPSPALMVTNLDASNYPSIRVPVTRGGKSEFVPLRFDRILCDVPCSGDGTIRKNMGIWKSWQPMDGNGLHSLQVRILLRAMKMLNDDGRIVYSTCSLNPVENEAVVAEALNLSPAFELVDVSSQHAQLKRRPGLTSWRATGDKTCLRTFESYEEFLASSLDEGVKGKLSAGHWPPTNAQALHLHRCMRIYPHLQDTGGFFVAVLQKKVPLDQINGRDRKREASKSPEPADVKRPRLETHVLQAATFDNGNTETSSNDEQPIDVINNHPSKSRPPMLDGVFKENPYTYLGHNDAIVQSCIRELQITSAFPVHNILVRNPDGAAAKSLYISNDIVKTIIVNNSYERLRLTSAGTKVFAKQEVGKGSEAQFRVLGEGLPVVLPYLKAEAIIIANISSLHIFLESPYPLCTRFDNDFQQKIEVRSIGSHVVRFVAETNDDASLTHDLILPIWRSKISLALMIDKKSKSALSLRVFSRDITSTLSSSRDVIS
ncbi:S-adenosyl-L-methionine-dependent methyltransferase [Crepidotus variabilis]|uniref:S-adenosyl-L-methionine-dependent methyltransferase n=1 Tax=Crepidotus variabilis TaxID=179855 RepID=A0A9P6E2Z8_9AGAR|nr:S-adenosyl-L-methionine-dependent methyltransferase [Crepidotus variabilis]